MTRRLYQLLSLAVCALLTGCDHATKQLATHFLADRDPVTLVPGLFDVRYTENHDIAFSLLQSLQHEHKAAILAWGTLAMTLVIAFTWWRRRESSALEQLGYALIISGALGNVIDRMKNGYVVDFLHLHFWPVFNVADVAIVVGFALFAFAARQPSAPTAPARG